jgi:hypothetical protein
MTDRIKKVAYFTMAVADKPGAAASMLQGLSELGVNLLAFSGFPRGRRSQLDFVPEDVAVFRKAAKKVGIAVQAKKAGFLVQGEDRRGAIGDVLEKLAAAGINVTAVDAVSAGSRRYGAILWVKPADLKKAAKALMAV